MGLLLNFSQGACFLNNLNFYHHPINVFTLLHHKSYSHCRFRRIHRRVQLSSQGGGLVSEHAEKGLQQNKVVNLFEESFVFPAIQTLRRFPKEELSAKIVMVRFDSAILLQEELDTASASVTNAILTIRYLYEAGAKVILVSDWSKNLDTELPKGVSVADLLTLVLQLKVSMARWSSASMASKMKELEKGDVLLLENLSESKEERANCANFAERLTLGVDIFVNDTFSQSHRILASTVGVARFCYACLAGFHFEEGLYHLKKVAENNRKPYLALIGGANLSSKAVAVHFLTSLCDGLVFVGMMAFQIMHAFGLHVPYDLLEHGALEEASNIIQYAQYRNIPILYPKEFLCMNDHNQLKLFAADGILDGWVPVDLGPNSLVEIESLLLNSKKLLWIGPAKFRLSNSDVIGASKVALMLDKVRQNDCDLTIIGKTNCKLMRELSPTTNYSCLATTTVMWDFMKGRKLPGMMALDRAFPFGIDWGAAYCKPANPLVVDIGSGNGLFLLGMAQRRADLNFLGLEINEKLVRRCMASLQLSGLRNGHFIAANATTTFRSIISSYPGHLVLVSIQCPDPDFNKPNHRWRLLQRSLIEAVADLLAPDGMVFLQSDIEAVAMKMKEQFLKYGKGKFVIRYSQHNAKADQEGWLQANPFGVQSDWEQHVVARGDPMYRIMLSKSLNTE